MQAIFLTANVDLSDAEQKAQQVTNFFTTNDLKTIANTFLTWGIKFAGSILLAIIVWFVGKKIIKMSVKFVGKVLDKSQLDIGVVKFLQSLTKFGGYIILAIIVIGILGVQTSSFVALLGSAGLTFGLALQGSLSNFAGGVLILMSKPFVVGDYIISGTNEGTVKTIDLLYTKLSTADNKMVMIPNGTLANSSITNVGAQPTRRLDIAVSVGYNSDIKNAKELLRKILEKQPQIMTNEEITVIVKSLDDSCVTLETRAWVKADDYWNTKWELLERYKEVFDAHGIEIPYNQLDVNIRSNS